MELRAARVSYACLNAEVNRDVFLREEGNLDDTAELANRRVTGGGRGGRKGGHKGGEGVTRG